MGKRLLLLLSYDVIEMEDYLHTSDNETLEVRKLYLLSNS